MALLPLILLGTGAALAFGGKKKRRRSKKPALPSAMEPPTLPQEAPTIRWVAEEWWIPESWFEGYATPRLQEIVMPRHVEGIEMDPLDVTLELLQGQTAGFDLPSSGRAPGEDEMWQVDVPNAANFYDGPESVLGLLYHVADYVNEGLGRWQAGDELYLAELAPYEEGD